MAVIQQINVTPVSCRLMKATKILVNRKQKCAFSNQPIKEGDDVWLLLNNYKHVPNCWVLDSEVRKHSWYVIFDRLNELYVKYLECKDLEKRFFGEDL